ncbi:Crp/Fnr family transcriptional regulator [Niabella soli]|uniref:Crp/Fnr family transcription regulator n=1 Tax=Niabella soli DSM 19437 TaxID=929713 RepID=W0F0D7_9BACT|nr:Crp/Fnr family transcriptional regulator [Niabella soli]AHF15283.1 Crp/Fnr family transcription regulator [Niabella soli DSM 19437]
MQIAYSILAGYGAITQKINKGEFVFLEGAQPFFFYQVLEGEIRLYSSSSEDRELTQGIFRDGETFGEPPLLLGKRYPSTAEASKNSTIIKIRKENFLALLKDHPGLYERMLYHFAGRIYNKATTAQIWVNQRPEEKILRLLKKIKGKSSCPQQWCVPYTRQQIADHTGLAVETVIRTLSRMNKEGKIKIFKHKLYY